MPNGESQILVLTEYSRIPWRGLPFKHTWGGLAYHSRQCMSEGGCRISRHDRSWYSQNIHAFRGEGSRSRTYGGADTSQYIVYVGGRVQDRHAQGGMTDLGTHRIFRHSVERAPVQERMGELTHHSRQCMSEGGCEEGARPEKGHSELHSSALCLSTWLPRWLLCLQLQESRAKKRGHPRLRILNCLF